MEEYTNRELYLLMEELIKNNNTSHDRIEAQVKKTNGRVSDLEKWKYGISGALALMGVIVGFLGFKLTIPL